MNETFPHLQARMTPHYEAQSAPARVKVARAVAEELRAAEGSASAYYTKPSEDTLFYVSGPRGSGDSGVSLGNDPKTGRLELRDHSATHGLRRIQLGDDPPPEVVRAAVRGLLGHGVKRADRAALKAHVAALRAAGGRASFAEGDAPAPRRPTRRTPFAAFAEQPPRPLAPEDALAFFLALAPGLSVAADAKAFAESQRTRAAELADHTDGVLLARVLGALADPAVAAGGVDAVLDGAGVGVSQSSYGRTVFRERAVTEYVGGLDAERREPDVVREYPYWQYHAKVRPTSRPHHAARDLRLYRASAAFADVRGHGPGEEIGCLCCPSPVRRDDLPSIRSRGRVRHVRG